MDKIVKLGSSTVHHGKFNDRVYLMSMADEDAENITEMLGQLCDDNDYSKIVAKVPSRYTALFIQEGYEKEASLPLGDNGGYVFMSKFVDPERRTRTGELDEMNIIETAKQKVPDVPLAASLPAGYHWSELTKEDAAEAAEVYSKVFESYPFPINTAEYILETMEDHVRYFGVWGGGGIAALSSAEMDKKNKTVEMTDFATLPDFRGAGLALFLLDRMEEKMVESGYGQMFTIARSKSPGMNITFAKKGYSYGGTLVNNTNISGGLESMNIWYKNAGE